MAASIPWTEALLCIWTAIVAVVAYRIGRAVTPQSGEPAVGRFDYRLTQGRKQQQDQQEYDDPWSEALRDKGQREDTV